MKVLFDTSVQESSTAEEDKSTIAPLVADSYGYEFKKMHRTPSPEPPSKSYWLEARVD